MRLCTTRLVSVLKFLVWLEDGYEAESAETASVREENQRLDKLVRQQKAGASPAEKARTPRVERSQNQTPQNL